jgi:hypothetical protein
MNISEWRNEFLGHLTKMRDPPCYAEVEIKFLRSKSNDVRSGSIKLPHSRLKLAPVAGLGQKK